MQNVTQYDDDCMYYAIFEAQFIKKLSNTETALKKSVAYKKESVYNTLYLFLKKGFSYAIIRVLPIH